MIEELHDHHRGLGFDLSTLIARRRLLTMFAGAVVAASCGSDSTSSATPAAATPTAAGTDTAA